MLSISYRGVEFLHPKTRESIMFFPYIEVKNYESEGMTFFLTIMENEARGNFEEIREMTYSFRVEQVKWTGLLDFKIFGKALMYLCLRN